jgi:hypothetical protein
MTDLSVRFWQKVNKSGPTPAHFPQIGNCWIWIASGQRYGKIRRSGIYVLAHKISWELANGPVPSGMCVLHRCDNPKCVRPDHLWLGTLLDNVRDRELKRRHPHLNSPPRAYGEKNPAAKLTQKQVQSILKMRGRQVDIGRRFGVAQTTVSRIKLGQSWSKSSGSSGGSP